MKDKLIIFIIGVLVGSIISTGSIYIYNMITSTDNGSQNTNFNGGNFPERPDNNGIGQPPSMPNNNSENKNETDNK